MATPEQSYAAQVIWDGNRGSGTATYQGYGRSYRVLVSGKPDLAGTADPAFLGEAAKHNPEDLFLASISACHMLFYLALCARQGVRVLAYEDRVVGVLRMDGAGGGRFDEIVLHPRVKITNGADTALAASLHDVAHERCFIANSCRARITHHAVIETDSKQTEPTWTT